MIIGITGGTGCGKSTLLRELEKLGAQVVDCDLIYHQLLEQSPQLLADIQRRFPNTVVDGKLQRKVLGSIVFSDKEALADLERITHAAIRQEVLRRLDNVSFGAIDAVGLFESGLADCCDITVAVIAPTERRIARIMTREGISRQYAESRIAAQHDNAWFQNKCDYTLENQGDLPGFQSKCLAFLWESGIITREQ